MHGTRSYQHERRTCDVLVVGGGMAGIAAAVTAAREGAKVALVHDRPVLGGNASTEVRVNLEGANGGFHNRFFVESGLAEDLLLENFWKNPTGSADHWSAILLDLVLSTDGLDLYLDTHVNRVLLDPDGSLASVEGITLSSERSWTFEPHFAVDATGDGTIAYLAGAMFMRGEEGFDTFAEPLAPAESTDLKLGGTMQFMCKDLGRPVDFEPPKFARKVTADELRINRNVDVWGQEPVLGGFWWIEYGGHLDTIGDNPDIKLALLAEVFGVWDYIKNSPDWRERNRNLDLEWVAAMPGKRESRRISGDHVLTENDLMQGNRFEDAVAFGGWSLDRHAPLGFMSFDEVPCTQVHPPGVYQIPLGSLYARDIPNLYLAGRNISCSHIACCSARVMLTCTSCGEAVGAAAALSADSGAPPRAIAADPLLLRDVRCRLERSGHYVPFVPLEADRLPDGARVSSSSVARLEQPEVTELLDLSKPRMLSIPLIEPHLDSVSLWFQSSEPAALHWRLHGHRADGSWLPGEELSRGGLEVAAHPDGDWVELPIAARAKPGYVHLSFACDSATARVGASAERPLGPLSWRSHVAELDRDPVDRRAEDRWALPQETEEHYNDSTAFIFSFWRRDGHGWGGPPGPGLTFRSTPLQAMAAAPSLLDPYERPTVAGVHGWVSARQPGGLLDGKFIFDEPQWVAVDLPEPIDAEAIELYFDSDVDRHLANLWYCHPPGRHAIPSLLADCTVDVRSADGTWTTVHRLTDNFRRRATARVDQVIDGFRINCLATNGLPYATLVDVRLRTGAAS